jgi:two-component system sensor histidine kinase BarA
MILLKPISEKSLFETISRWLDKSTTPSITSHHETTVNPLATIYDSNQGLELAGGNAQLANELFAMLIKELSGYRQRIELSLSQSDLSELKYHTHKLHGATSYCGVPMLRHVAQELESIIDNKQQMKLDKAVHDVLEAIDALLTYQQTQI